MKKIILGTLIVFILTFSFVSASKKEADFCTYDYSPVCGVDGITYGNKCMAGKVKIDYSGECKEENIISSACPAIYMPVVGTDGKTYSNECMAKAAGKLNDKKTIEIDNPASRFCISQGGKSEFRINKNGDKFGVCIFKNGDEFEEWEFFRSSAEGKISDEKLLNSYLDFDISLPMPELDSEIFLNKYGESCVSATDSVNIHFIKDGKFNGSTRVGVPSNFKPNYICLSYKGLILEEETKYNFENSLKVLSLENIKLINSILKKIYEDKNNFERNLFTSQYLVDKLDNIRNNKNEEKKAIIDYIKYQVISLFKQK